MLLRLRIGTGDSLPIKWRSGNRLLSLFYSVSLHAALVAFGFFGPELDPPDRLALYRATMVPAEKEHKILYYDFRTELPEVSATNATAKVPSPGPDALQSKQRIVAALQEKDGKQLVWLPQPRIELQQDLKAPNLIAFEPPSVPSPEKPAPRPFQAPEPPKIALSPTAALPTPPPAVASEKQATQLTALLNKPPAGPPPKEFVAPKQTKKAAAPAPVLADAPAIAERDSAKQGSELSSLLNKPAGPPPKEFVAPKQTKGAAAPAPVLANAPAIAENGGARQGGELSSLLSKPAGPPPKEFIAPKSEPRATTPAASLPSAPALSGVTGAKPAEEVSALLNRPLAGPPPKPFAAPTARGNSDGHAASSVALPAAPSVPASGQPAAASVAIIGLNPANVPQIPTPEGSRPARIVAGAPGASRPELGGGNSPISAPNLSIQGAAATATATATSAALDRSQTQPATGLAHVQMPRVLPTTPHVSVPQWPNTRTLPSLVERHFLNRVAYVTLIPSQTGEDWVVWFGEFGASPMDPRLLIRPPILLQSAALPPVPAHSDHGTGRIRVLATIHTNGRVDATSDLAGASLDRELIGALQAWQFSPATRNGVPFEADAVIEIPVAFGTISLR